MKTLLILVLAASTLLGSSSLGATALEALKVIPGANLANLAIVEGHDGNPSPARWHFLFYDPATANGIREYVVEDGNIVAEREVSQFATSLKPSDVVGTAGLSVDSDAVARTAQRWAEAAGQEVASMNFTLRKDDENGGAPVWSATCVGEDGVAFAEMKMTGDGGRIVSHDGFTTDPAATAARTSKRGGFHQPALTTKHDEENRVAELRFYYDSSPLAAELEDQDRPTSHRKSAPSRRERTHLPNPIDDVVIPIHRFVRSMLPF